MDIESYHLAQALRNVLCAYMQNYPVPIKKPGEGETPACGNKEVLRVALEKGWEELGRFPSSNFSEAYGLEKLIERRASSLSLWVSIFLALVGIMISMSSWTEDGKPVMPFVMIKFVMLWSLLCLSACTFFVFSILFSSIKLRASNKARHGNGGLE